jgi:hypothetical protein
LPAVFTATPDQLKMIGSGEQTAAERPPLSRVRFEADGWP